jgi:phosphomannomutase
MAALRAAPSDDVGGVAVTMRRDLLAQGGPEATDALVWDLVDGARLTFRPSGTEPKLKVYLEVVEPVGAATDAYAEARARAERRLEELIAALEPRLARRA